MDTNTVVLPTELLARTLLFLGLTEHVHASMANSPFYHATVTARAMTTHLDLGPFYRWLDDNRLFSIVSMYPRAHTIDISRAFKVNGSAIAAACDVRSHRMNAENIPVSPPRCGNFLTHFLSLSLDCVMTLEDKNLQLIAKACSKLTHLSLNGCF
jgi:hypothetical protein